MPRKFLKFIIQAAVTAKLINDAPPTLIKTLKRKAIYTNDDEPEVEETRERLGQMEIDIPSEPTDQSENQRIRVMLP